MDFREEQDMGSENSMETETLTDHEEKEGNGLNTRDLTKNMWNQ